MDQKRARQIRAPSMPDVLEARLHGTTCKHCVTALLRAPAPTLIVLSSAPEPLLALGVGVNEPPSPRECFIGRQERRAARQPLATERQARRRNTAHIELSMLWIMIWPAAGAARGEHGVTLTELRGNTSKGELHMLSCTLGARASGLRWEQRQVRAARPAGSARGSGHMGVRRSSDMRSEGEGAPACCITRPARGRRSLDSAHDSQL